MKRVSTIIIITLALGGCANLRIAGGIETPYGSIMSDGKTVRILARPFAMPSREGFAK